MLYIIYICVYKFIHLFIHLSRFFFYYCALCVLSLMELFYVYFIVYDHVHAFVGASTHFKWELMLYCLHCPTLNKVFLLLLLL